MRIKFVEELGDKDFYTEEGVESRCEDDGISIEEEGFMVGYLAA